MLNPRSALLLGPLAFLVSIGHLRAREVNGFLLEGALVPEEEILPGGPPRDGIPAIHRPDFASAEKALETYGKGTRVIVVRGQKEVRAYPIPVLNWHEVVNDEIDGEPIAVTYCPLCGTGVVFKAKVGGETLKFGVSGLLYQSDLLLYDLKTLSLWSQLLLKAVTGEQKGKTLEVHPSRAGFLEEVIEEEPEVMVLSIRTGFRRDYKRDPYSGYEKNQFLLFPVRHQDARAPLKAWSLLLRARKEALIVPLPALDPGGNEIAVTLGGKEIVVEYDAARNLIGCKAAIEGIDCITGYYFALRAFYPEARVHPAAEEAKDLPGGVPNADDRR